MKKTVIAIMALTLVCSTQAARKNATVPDVQQTTEADTTDREILHELEKIYNLHHDTKTKIEEAREKRQKEAQKNQEEKEDLPDEYSAMLRIEDNTHQHWWADGWNLFGILTFIAAVISAFYAYFTFREQKKTEAHTSNAPVEVQLWKLKDLPRHFWRNLVCTSALIFRFKAQDKSKPRDHYPSESNLLKLETLPDDVVMPIDINKNKVAKDNPYKHAHELKVLLRNYNVEVEVASEHLSHQHIEDQSLEQDFDNLMFKPIHLVKSTFKYRNSLSKESDEQMRTHALTSFIKEHFTKLMIASNFQFLASVTAKELTDKVFDGRRDIHTAFREEIDTTRGMERSLQNLIDSESTIQRSKIQALLEAEFREDDKEKDFNQYFALITDPSKFDELCNSFYSNLNDTERGLISKAIIPYQQYLSQNTWKWHELLKYMLVVDAAIETNKIGMVNYK